MSWSIIELLFGNLCISSMENDEKKDKDQPNFKFLVPFSPNTPRIEKHSSVFFTPPYSNEGPSSLSRAPRCINEKIPFDLSIGSEDFTDKFDIMRGLSDKGLVFTVCNLIFGCLDDLSLCRASQVSKTWKNIIRVKSTESKKRVHNFLTRQKDLCIEKGKENVGLQKRAYTSAQSIMECTPETNNSKVFKPNNDSTRCIEFNKLEKGKYRPCPKCNSPAKIDREQLAAQCYGCSERFCVNCFKKWDDNCKENCSPAKTKGNSPPVKGKQKKMITGTMQSRNRLRRLSRQKR